MQPGTKFRIRYSGHAAINLSSGTRTSVLVSVFTGMSLSGFGTMIVRISCRRTMVRPTFGTYGATITPMQPIDRMPVTTPTKVSPSAREIDPVAAIALLDVSADVACRLIVPIAVKGLLNWASITASRSMVPDPAASLVEVSAATDSMPMVAVAAAFWADVALATASVNSVAATVAALSDVSAAMAARLPSDASAIAALTMAT